MTRGVITDGAIQRNRLRDAAEFGRQAAGAEAPMAASRRYPREWLDPVPAIVFACLLPGELRIVLFPGVGMVDGGAPYDVPAMLVPPDLRMPNTPIWVRFDDDLDIIRIWRRETPAQG